MSKEQETHVSVSLLDSVVELLMLMFRMDGLNGVIMFVNEQQVVLHLAAVWIGWVVFYGFCL